MDLPWHLPADLRHFKRLTTGHPLVMGRRTFESLVHQFGGPLPNRDNVVLTRDPEAAEALRRHGADVYDSLARALAAYAHRDVIFLGGGASVYADALSPNDRREGGRPLADRLELTRVLAEPSGDTHFPPFEHLLGTAYERTFAEEHPAEEGRPAFRFETWVRGSR